METTAIPSAKAVKATMVALANIQPNTFNPHNRFIDVSLSELAESIRQQGVIQPIALRNIADTDRYEIIYGERRYRASLIAEKENIPALVYDVDDATAQEMAIAENLQREDITPTEEANAFQRLIDSGRHDVQSLAVQFGKSVNYIRSRLKFTSLIPEIAQMLDTALYLAKQYPTAVLLQSQYNKNEAVAECIAEKIAVFNDQIAKESDTSTTSEPTTEPAEETPQTEAETPQTQETAA